MSQTITPDYLAQLQCPVTGQSLHREGAALMSEDGKYRYAITPSGIPLFAEDFCTPEARAQRDHYNETFAAQYTTNLGYPHTQEYMAYLDRVLLREIAPGDLSNVAEICCGHGELSELTGNKVAHGIGVDIAPAMLEQAVKHKQGQGGILFVQGDAHFLPLKDSSFGSVFMLGGVHHVPDRAKLFAEVSRILQPGGRFYFREPVSDFFLWRAIRWVIYRLSPALDATTERPLVWAETVPVLQQAGFNVKIWKTYGFIGFCLFMNSDVMVFNRLFRYLPGIRRITRFFAWLDDRIARLPLFNKWGLQVVCVAEKAR